MTIACSRCGRPRMEVGKTIESVTPCACSQKPKRSWITDACILVGLLISGLIGAMIGWGWR